MRVFMLPIVPAPRADRITRTGHNDGACQEVPFELFFGDLEASPYHGAVLAQRGRLTVPSGPGLGLEPDMRVIERYRLGAATVIGA
jgi:L-alanine-DL-glutamate epimerase-like enolase superfamily enzyme